MPQLPSALGASEMHQTHQELIKRQGNKPERKYQALLSGTPLWVQHRQNATWELATMKNQCAPNSYLIMQENSAEQPKVYRCTRTMLKIRSTPTDGEQKANWGNGQQKQIMWSFTSQLFPMGTETSQSRILMDILHPAVSQHHYQHYIFQNLKIFQKSGRKTASFQDHYAQVVLHWKMHLMHQMHQCNVSQQERTLENSQEV